MKLTRTSDLILNVAFPLLCGILLYAATNSFEFPAVIRNHLADGLWAYALLSCILIIWDRKLNPMWVVISFVIVVDFELMQHWDVIPGTGDVYDVITCWLFFAIAIQLNNFFKHIVKLQS
jgi:hypothetical protein